jgi:hypothetical protein
MSKVPVFDTNSNHLRRCPSRVITGRYSYKESKSRLIIPADASLEKEKFEKVKIPRFGLFDIYASNDTDEHHPTSHAVIARATQDTYGKSFVARLNYGRLGPGANLRRAFSSKHRIMYIGSVAS